MRQRLTGRSSNFLRLKPISEDFAPVYIAPNLTQGEARVLTQFSDRVCAASAKDRRNTRTLIQEHDLLLVLVTSANNLLR